MLVQMVVGLVSGSVMLAVLNFYSWHFNSACLYSLLFYSCEFIVAI